ncbi:MAG: L-fucose/D-arabinose isomerase [Solirubrobacteraceae bacterium]|nr:L-fucose/D-arabinose isomerase [Solirubrobacteraceae bacterium]
MRSTPIGLVMLNDERPHVVAENEAENMAELRRWAEAIKGVIAGTDGRARRSFRRRRRSRTCAPPSRSASSCAVRAAARS